ncbi:NADH-quinone oxidoreductase subunit N [Streptomyces radicis]|uniref:NADH-quinone oxidoreductase subunit N n=1 Tax=Streptomyces radicis TaxID=1750517 RepID=A0A3A9VYA0_9ACTN|nr:NADH-quinone oxidoreductase subunit N [Streptomyces radicis]RKN05502.1 NADH-quinone oxidoreductase subunit N [Streptomyces radicis]RKN17371.1 NADH-quinone oxidoreductase subunit N [Streptomyces radicis]
MNLVQSVEWAVFAPPLIAAVAAVAVLVTDLFLPAARKAVLGWLAVGGLALAALALVPLRDGDRATFCLPGDAGLCSYSADRFAVIVQLLVLAGAFLAALLSLPGSGERDDEGEDGEQAPPSGEFWFLLLCSASGAALLPAARDLATLVIALEVTTLPAYALVGLRRAGAPVRNAGPEAALKFFLASITATAVGLLGISFVYAGAGSLHLAEIAEQLPAADPGLATLAEAGVVLTLVAFAFKVAAVPFHFWVPETYLGAPLPVAAYLSVVGKTAGLAGLALVTSGAFPGHGDLWGPALAVLAGLTMTAGNVAALRTDPEAPHSAIRLLAWSSVGQAGYLLVPLAAAAYTDEGAVGTAVAYALMYGAVNLGAFAVAAHVARHARAHRIADYGGLWARQPFAALALAFFLLCLAGLPPGVIGLFAKVAVFESAVDAGLGVLAVVMALNVAIALYYYLRWTAVLFRAEPGGASRVGMRPAAPLTGAIALTAAVGAILSGAPQIILTFASGTFL